MLNPDLPKSPSLCSQRVVELITEIERIQLKALNKVCITDTNNALTSVLK